MKKKTFHNFAFNNIITANKIALNYHNPIQIAFPHFSLRKQFYCCCWANFFLNFSRFVLCFAQYLWWAFQTDEEICYHRNNTFCMSLLILPDPGKRLGNVLERNKNETFIPLARIVLKSWTAANKDCWTFHPRFFLLLLALLMRCRRRSCWVVQTSRLFLKPRAMINFRNSMRTYHQ